MDPSAELAASNCPSCLCPTSLSAAGSEECIECGVTLLPR